MNKKLYLQNLNHQQIVLLKLLISKSTFTTNYQLAISLLANYVSKI